LLRVYRWTRIVTRQRRNIKNKTLRQRSSSPSSVAIFQHHQHMEITFRNLYLIPEVAHSTVIFLTVLGYWRNSSVADFWSKLLLSTEFEQYSKTTSWYNWFLTKVSSCSNVDHFMAVPVGSPTTKFIWEQFIIVRYTSIHMTAGRQVWG
jgi:hypothetical protein